MLTATACGSAIAVSVTGAAVFHCLAAAAGYYIPLNLLHHLRSGNILPLQTRHEGLAPKF